MKLNIEAPPARHGRKWMPDELLFVEVNAHTWTWQQMAQHLQRKPANVYRHAFLTLCGGRQRLNAAEAGEKLGVSRSRMAEWLRADHCDGRRFRSVPRCNSDGQRMWRVEYDNLLAFVSDPWYFRLIDVRHIRDAELADTASWARRAYGHLYVDVAWLAPRCSVTPCAVVHWMRHETLPGVKVPAGQGAWQHITPRSVADAWIAEYVDASRPPRHCAPTAHAAAAEATGFDAEIAAPWRPAWRWPAEA